MQSFKRPVKLQKNEIKTMTESKKKPREHKKKQRKLIIRNLSFKATEEELQEMFSKFGKVLNVNIPLSKDGRKRGFAFVQFDDMKSLMKAMNAMNYKEIHGRAIALDFAVDKTTYQLKQQSVKSESSNLSIKEESDSQSDSESIKSETEVKEEDISESEETSQPVDEKQTRVDAFMKEFDEGVDSPSEEEELVNESSSDESDSEDLDQKPTKIKTEEEPVTKKKEAVTSRKTNDVSEGRTVFLRNLSFGLDNAALEEAMSSYGDCNYCLVCMDRVTGHPKGTGFVKFKTKESADKLIEESKKEPGVFLEGRKVLCSPAISREQVSQMANKVKEPKDKRNLKLLRVGFIMPGSPESEGVSQSDMAKRAQLEAVKKQKLKNVNFFVSDKRLIVHNLPKDYTDKRLKALLKKAGGKNAVITEARVMKDLKKVDSQGMPLSKGFGFVSFGSHESALQALAELNNNPNVFTAVKRPIVEFSVENKVALLTKQRRIERLQMRNEQRSKKGNQERQTAKNISDNSTSNFSMENNKRKNLNQSRRLEKKIKLESHNVSNEDTPTLKRKNKKSKKKSNQKTFQKTEKQVKNCGPDNMKHLINKYKNKLIYNLPKKA